MKRQLQSLLLTSFLLLVAPSVSRAQSDESDSLLTVRPSLFTTAPSLLIASPLHAGFNASVDMGVSVGLGKHNPWRGATFHTAVSGTYVHHFSNRLTLAGGGYVNNFTGWGSGTTAGIYGLANYQLNDRLDGTLYFTHDFGLLEGRSRFMGPYVPAYTSPATTVGADLGIRLGDRSKMTVGISFTRGQSPYGFGPFDHDPMRLGY